MHEISFDSCTCATMSLFVYYIVLELLLSIISRNVFAISRVSRQEQVFLKIKLQCILKNTMQLCTHNISDLWGTIDSEPADIGSKVGGNGCKACIAASFCFVSLLLLRLLPRERRRRQPPRRSHDQFCWRQFFFHDHPAGAGGRSSGRQRVQHVLPAIFSPPARARADFKKYEGIRTRTWYM